MTDIVQAIKQSYIWRCWSASTRLSCTWLIDHTYTQSSILVTEISFENTDVCLVPTAPAESNLNIFICVLWMCGLKTACRVKIEN